MAGLVVAKLWRVLGPAPDFASCIVVEDDGIGMGALKD